MCRRRGGAREEKPDTLGWKHGAGFPGPGPSRAPGGPPEVSGFVPAAANRRRVPAQPAAATLRLLARLKGATFHSETTMQPLAALSR